MEKYLKPEVIKNEEVAEGIYLASGSVVYGAHTCDSIYIKGVFEPTTKYDGTRRETGCFGCPANWWDGVCHRETQSKGDIPFMPSWEYKSEDPNGLHNS